MRAMVSVALFLAPWVAIGAAVFWIAFRGPTSARAAGGPMGGRGLRVGVPLAFLALGVLVPGAVIADRGGAVSGEGQLASVAPSPKEARGRVLFQQTCATCHSLAAVNDRGVTGPNLDQLGVVDERRVATAIKNGGTGQGRMPAGLLEGPDAEAVAAFVAKTAGKQ